MQSTQHENKPQQEVWYKVYNMNWWKQSLKMAYFMYVYKMWAETVTD